MENLDEQDDELELALEDLYNNSDDNANDDESTTQGNQEPSEMTRNMSKRINEVKAKTERETMDKVAKELGFDNYAQLKSRQKELKEQERRSEERELIEEAGFDEDEITPLLDKLIQKRLDSDPKLQRLLELEAREKESFAIEQLKEVNKLFGTNFKSINEVSKDVLEFWEKTGNLKQAYLAINGEKMLVNKSTQSHNGSMEHLASIGGASRANSMALNDEEKAYFKKLANEWGMGIEFTDEELSKIKKPK